MDDMSLVYNINLCRICQIPNNFDLISTSAITDNGQTYLDLLKFIFNDITWAEDTLISLACHSCVKKIKDTAEFKSLCLESNTRRGTVSLHAIKLEIESTENWGIIDCDKNELEIEVQTSVIKLEGQSPHNSTLIGCIGSPKSKRRKKEAVRKRRGRPRKDTTISAICDGPNNVNKMKNDNRKRKKCKTTGGRYHLCDICQKECKNLEEFDRHMNKHDGSRNYVCNVCGRTYITRDDLKQHSYRHNTEATYQCQICPNKKFKTARDFRTHKKIVHMNREDYKYLCTECGMKFPQLCALKTHILRRHSTIRDFKCDICGKDFAEKSDLKDHHTTHTNVRPFKCDLCPAEYKRKDVLRNHKSKHHGIGNYKFPVEKKYDCSYCGKKVTKDKLKRHIRTHTGVKPFSCRLCDMKFICNSYIKGHLKLKHQMDVEASEFNVKFYYNVTQELLLEESGETAASSVIDVVAAAAHTCAAIVVKD